MSTNKARIRLYVSSDLAAGATVVLTRDQSHYLGNVMRKARGEAVLCFNGRDGEWLCEIADLRKQGGAAVAQEQTRAQAMPPDLRLLFAPIKKARTDFIVEKAAEMGARAVQPVITRYTNSERLRIDKLNIHAAEAAEQCGGLYVPPVHEPVRLETALAALEPDRALMFCDEAMEAPPGLTALGAAKPGPWAILIGPEGGFSPEERERIAGHPNALRVTLGPRILRADTAAVAAMTLWQLTLGDWQ